MVKSKKALENDRRALGRKKEGGEDDSYSFDDGGGGATDSGEDVATTAPDLSMDALRKVFHLPCVDAAAALGVAHSKLKRRCHKLKISRWPQRKLASLVFLRDALPNDPRLTEVQRQYIINKIDDEYGKVMRDPNHPLDKELEQLRKSNYKLNYNRKLKCAAKTGKRAAGSGDNEGGGGGSRRKEAAAERAVAAERARAGAGSTGWGGLTASAGAPEYGGGTGEGPDQALGELPPYMAYWGHGHGQGPGITSPAESGPDPGTGAGVVGGGPVGGTDSPGWDAGGGDEGMYGDGMYGSGFANAAAAALAQAVAASGGGGIGSPGRKVAQRRLAAHLGGGGGSPGGGLHAPPGRRSSLERIALLSAINEGKISKQGAAGRRQSGSGSGSATPRQMGGPGSSGALPPGLPLLASGSVGGPASPRRLLSGSAGPQSPRLRRGVGSPAGVGPLGATSGGHREPQLLHAWGQPQPQQQLGQTLMVGSGGAGEEEWTGRPPGRPLSPPHQQQQQRPGYGSAGLVHGQMGLEAAGLDGYAPGMAGDRGQGYGHPAVADTGPRLGSGGDPYGGGAGGQYGRASEMGNVLAAGINSILADTDAMNLLAGLEAAAGGGRQTLGAEQLSEEELALLGIQGPDRDLILDATSDASLDPLLDLLLADGFGAQAGGQGRQQQQQGEGGPQSSLHQAGVYQQQGDRASFGPGAHHHHHQPQQHGAHGLAGPYTGHGHVLGRRMSDAVGPQAYSDGAASVMPVGVSALHRTSGSGLGPGAGGGFGGGGGGYGASHSAPYRQHRLSSVTGTGQRVSRFANGVDMPGGGGGGGSLPAPLDQQGGYGLSDAGPGSGGLTGFRSLDEAYEDVGGRGVGVGVGGAYAPGRAGSAHPYGARFGGAAHEDGGPVGDASSRRWQSSLLHPHHQVMATGEGGRHSAPGNIGIPGWDDGPAGFPGGGFDARRTAYDMPLGGGEPRRMLQSSTGALQPVPEQIAVHGSGSVPAGPGGGVGIAAEGGWRDAAGPGPTSHHELLNGAGTTGDAGGAGASYLDEGPGGPSRHGGVLPYGGQYNEFGEVSVRAAIGRRLDRNLGSSWGPGSARAEGLQLPGELGRVSHARSASSSGFGHMPPEYGGLRGLNGGASSGGGGSAAEMARGGSFGYDVAGGAGGAPASGGRGYSGVGSLSALSQFDRREQAVAREQLVRAMHRSNSNNSTGFAGGSSGGGLPSLPPLQRHESGSGSGVDPAVRAGGMGRLTGPGSASLTAAGGPPDYPGAHHSPTPETIASLQGLRLRGEEDRPAASSGEFGYAAARGHAPPGGGSGSGAHVEHELAAVMQELQDLRRQRELRTGGPAPGPGPGPGAGQVGPRGGAAGAAAASASAAAYGGGGQLPLSADPSARYNDVAGYGGGAAPGEVPRQRFVGAGGAAAAGPGGGELLEAVDNQLSDIDSFVERNLDLLRRNSSGFGSFLVEVGAAGGAGAVGGGLAGSGGSFSGRAGGAAGGLGGAGLETTEFMRENLRKELRQGSAEQWEEVLRQLGGGMSGAL